jgi:homoserine kinase
MAATPASLSPSGSVAPVCVRVPASSANVGPGFDVLGLALDLPLDVIVGHDALSGVEVGGDAGDGAVVVGERHPATKAFRHWGGEGPVAVRTAIPPGRGLGYSGAARVSGLLAAAAQRGRVLSEDRRDLLAVATELEGHPDNVAASIFGGLVVAAADRAIRVPLGCPAEVVAWIPAEETSTDAARATLPPTVTFADAVFNVGRVALLVAALATADVAALRAATEDRLHQDARLVDRPASRAALAALLEAGCWAAWLSGSGPTVAGLCSPEDAGTIAASLPEGGEPRVLAVAEPGARLVAGGYAP